MKDVLVETDAVNVANLKPHTVTGKLSGERLVITMRIDDDGPIDGPVPIRIVTASNDRGDR